MKHLSKLLIFGVGLTLGYLLSYKQCEFFGIIGPPIQGNGKCDLVKPFIKIGFPATIHVYPFASAPIPADLAFVTITAENVKPGGPLTNKVSRTFKQGELSLDSFLNLPLMYFDASRVSIEVEYKYKDGSTCVSKVDTGDTIIWGDWPPRSKGSQSCAVAECTNFYSQTASTHFVAWSPGGTSGRIKLTVGGNVHVYEYGVDAATHLTNCIPENIHTIDGDEKYITFANSSNTAQYRIKWQCSQDTPTGPCNGDQHRLVIECLANCPLSVTACKGQ
jgi:hypothetical protein